MTNPSELFNRTVSIEPRTNGKVTKAKSFNKDLKRQWYGVYTGKKERPSARGLLLYEI